MQRPLVPRRDLPALRARLAAANDRLCAEYAVSRYLDREPALDPLSDLVHALLGHRTRYDDNDRAYHALLDRYGGTPALAWPRVRDAPVADVLAAIQCVTWPEKKAPAIQAVLRAISAARGGDLSLDFLAALPPREARAWLERLPGVGPKTSAIVVLYSTLRMPALVIDTHHHRVTTRLGLVPPGTPPAKAEPLLEELVPASWGAVEHADHHLALFRHGQARCFAQAPDCARCVVLDLCPHGAARVRPAGAPKRAPAVPPKSSPKSSPKSAAKPAAKRPPAAKPRAKR